MKPAPTSWIDGQKKGAPTERNFKVLCSTTLSPASRSLELSVEEAFAMAEKALKGKVRTKLRCISNDVKWMIPKHRRKLPFQIFNELDAEFFRSALQGNISLGWSDVPDETLSRTCRAGRKGNPRIRIELSHTLLNEAHHADIVAALVHQMVHAYYLQCCGYRDRGHTGTGHDLKHEQPFQALLQCVGEHCEPLRGISSLDLWTPRRSTRYPTSRDPNLGASCCYARRRRFSDVDIRDWRDVARAKTASLEEAKKAKESASPDVYSVDKDGKETPPKSMKDWHLPPEACVLLTWEKRNYPVARTSIPDRPALTSSPYFKDGHLQLPLGTGEAEFNALYFLVVHGQYPPSLSILNSVTAPNHQVSQGPPSIRPFDANAPTYLVQLITAFRLGKVLQYKPLCDFAVAGLYSLASTAENPVAVLEQIYQVPQDWNPITAPLPTRSADSQLREWTRSWLAVRQSPLHLSQNPGGYRNNLAVVRICPVWNARYSQLKASSAELKEDDSIAEAMLQVSTQAQRASTPSPLRQPVPLQHHLHIPRQYMFPGGILPPQYREHSPSYTSHGRKFPDLRSLSQCLPEDRLQYPRVSPELAPTPMLDPQILDSYEKWEIYRAEMRRLRLESQGVTSPLNIVDDPVLPNIEQQRRPY
ncbi:MAG: hypothetical protein LQ346_006427 [Caloplaca aetnensis]|nr:MAG: hypothetical protein LQ346_006427 [Caloplaca aetnensis]